MAGLVPAIHVVERRGAGNVGNQIAELRNDVDARNLFDKLRARA
jgi:hypothetical protein